MASNTPRLDAVERQMAVNGNFDFWQRGTSFSTNGGYTADRWNQIFAGGYTQTVTQSTDVPTVAQSGFQSRYSLLLTNGTGASPTSGAYQEIRHILEGQDYQQIHGRKARLQFWCKSSVTGTFSVAFYNNTATRNYVSPFTVNAANTWEKKFIDLTLDSSGTWLFDNGRGLNIIWSLTAGSSFQTSSPNTWLNNGDFEGITGQTQWGATTGATFQLSQVMLIPQDFTLAGASNVDIPFQRAGRTIGHELAMCQRYYEKIESQGLQMTLTSFQANQERNWYSWKVTKRATPVVVATSPNIFLSGVSTAASSPDFTNADTNGTLIVFNNTLPVDQSRMITIATMTADAEL